MTFRELIEILTEKFPSLSDIVVRDDSLAVISSKKIIAKKESNYRNLIEEFISELEKSGKIKDRNFTDIDTSWEISEEQGLRFRVNIARFSEKKVFITLRWLRPMKWTIKDYHISQHIVETLINKVKAKKGGLFLVIGPTGSGKSSVMASIIKFMLENYPINVITLEDPIEYRLESGKGLITQREVGIDTPNFFRGLKSALRENPNVIFVGEVRDEETLDLMLQASETGHVVFATLHTSSARDTIERLVGMTTIEKQEYLRQMLSKVLIGILGVRMFDVDDKKVILHEFLNAENITIRSLIHKGDYDQIPTYQNDERKGHLTFLHCARKLIREKVYTRDEILKTGMFSPSEV